MGACVDAKLIKDETLNILLAGRDTVGDMSLYCAESAQAMFQTAITLTCAIYQLAEHPNILRKLRTEILKHIGAYRRPTYDDIREMKYLRAFINGKYSDTEIYFGLY